jgi:hypothetical protein
MSKIYVSFNSVVVHEWMFGRFVVTSESEKQDNKIWGAGIEIRL